MFIVRDRCHQNALPEDLNEGQPSRARSWYATLGVEESVSIGPRRWLAASTLRLRLRGTHRPGGMTNESVGMALELLLRARYDTICGHPGGDPTRGPAA
jgi:hypothetical protein